MKLGNSDASVLSLSCGEAGRDLYVTFLTVRTNALDDVLNDFGSGVVFAVSGEEVSKRDLEFLHVVADITRTGPHLNAVRFN